MLPPACRRPAANIEVLGGVVPASAAVPAEARPAAAAAAAPKAKARGRPKGNAAAKATATPAQRSVQQQKPAASRPMTMEHAEGEAESIIDAEGMKTEEGTEGAAEGSEGSVEQPPETMDETIPETMDETMGENKPNKQQPIDKPNMQEPIIPEPTDKPNKQPATSAGVKKRPAAAAASSSLAEPKRSRTTYSYMNYPDGAVAVRECGGKQLFQADRLAHSTAR